MRAVRGGILRVRAVEGIRSERGGIDWAHAESIKNLYWSHREGVVCEMSGRRWGGFRPAGGRHPCPMYFEPRSPSSSSSSSSSSTGRCLKIVGLDGGSGHGHCHTEN